MSDSLIENADIDKNKDLETYEPVNSQLNEEQAEKSIDFFITKIGMGKYQFITFILLAICCLLEGAEVISLSFLNLILENIWGVSDFQISLLGSCIFGGVFLGSLISGFLADTYGRKPIFLIFGFLVLITNIISSLAPNYLFLIISRSIFGICCGITGPVSSVIIAEITPSEYRGKVLVVVSSAFTVGELIGLGVAYLCLSSLQNGHWRILQGWVSIPVFFVVTIAIFYLEESPRYLLLEDFPKCITLINKLHKINHPEDNWEMSDEDILQLKNWVDRNNVNNNEDNVKLARLFDGINSLITPLLWVMWFSLSFVYYGIIYILPTVLEGLHDGADNLWNFADILITICGEIPAYILCYYTIEEPLFGRKNSLIYSFLFGGIFGVLAFFTTGSALMSCIFMLKFFATSGFGYIYPFTAEVYHTKYRTTGLGISAGVSRIGGAAMPWISNYSYSWTPTGPFLIYGLLFMSGTVAAFFLPYDTVGKELDCMPSDDREKLKSNQIDTI